MLTKRQRDVLEFIADFQARERGVSPSIREIGEALAFGSNSGVFRVLSALEERGFIRRFPNRNRAIELLTKPAPRTEKKPAWRPTFSLPPVGDPPPEVSRLCPEGKINSWSEPRHPSRIWSSHER